MPGRIAERSPAREFDVLTPGERASIGRRRDRKDGFDLHRKSALATMGQLIFDGNIVSEAAADSPIWLSPR